MRLGNKARIIKKKAPLKKFLDLKKWVKSIQTTGYNGVRTVYSLHQETPQYESWFMPNAQRALGHSGLQQHATLRYGLVGGEGAHGTTGGNRTRPLLEKQGLEVVMAAISELKPDACGQLQGWQMHLCSDDSGWTLINAR